MNPPFISSKLSCSELLCHNGIQYLDYLFFFKSRRQILQVTVKAEGSPGDIEFVNRDCISSKGHKAICKHIASLRYSTETSLVMNKFLFLLGLKHSICEN